ncbi:ribosomal maturation YjgA family protein [Paenibacillus albus]|uniref:DUF2809 domain-containing protein n=1 Tax=Paenibacillus albus TaxID=2495582 RepID=A0A3S9A5H1_9BACL|nr:DUF2809 domain-containing protein [Paenibacillus albus]AZN40951.1 DUF2809 domain-containing protein [Paenibacillus albus]
MKQHQCLTTFLTKRWLYVIAAGAVIVLGLAVRRYSEALPRWIAEHAGDSLWASMIYFGIRFFIYRQSLIAAAVISLCFCFADEFSQLYQADWINQIRDTTLGALILGHGFLVVDLIRYTVGIGAAYSVDRWLLQLKRHSF